LLLLGLTATFSPLHQLGLQGMPRRIYIYLHETGWGRLNLVATIGAFVILVGLLITLGNILHSARRGALATADPWGGDSLEWAAASPPAPYNFAQVPVISSRSPLWDGDAAPGAPSVTGLSDQQRELLVTTLLDALPDHRTAGAGPAISPLLAALATGLTFTVSMFTPWGLPLGIAVGIPVAVGWFWPRPPYQELSEQQPGGAR
jgi:cytochrome c oxidase subunit 1